MRNQFPRFKKFILSLLFPLYLFPIKLITYTLYFAVKSLIKISLSLINIFFETISYPFRGIKNLLKAALIIALIIYVIATSFVTFDYLQNQYGYAGKFLCSYDVPSHLKKSVVRVIGGYSEGTGFFISPKQIITNFHVIADEPSPKIILPDRTFVTPVKITAVAESDLAILYIEYPYPDLVLEFMHPYELAENEPLISAGYPLGSELVGDATTAKGNFIAFRHSTKDPVTYVQTDINLVQGMSGGPLVDRCGKVVGINTLALSGLSLFISLEDIQRLMPEFTEDGVVKIEVDPTFSPQDSVTAYYTYLKARRMDEGFGLLSRDYLQKTNIHEWSRRFEDIIDVEVFSATPYEDTDDTVFVKFSTKNWNDGEVDYHFYEGTWQTVLEDGVYKMLRSNIKEIEEPDLEWFYEGEDVTEDTGEPVMVE